MGEKDFGSYLKNVRAALFGVAVADAVGVPYEFRSRLDMAANPAVDMVGYGTYHQPPGTWSDDSTLTFCLAEALAEGHFRLESLARKFCRWRNEAYWTPHDELFDIGVTTSKSIEELENILKSNDLGQLRSLRENADEYDNGNGSLMRILPLLFYIKGKDLKDKFELTYDVSSLTHKHIRAAMACFIYLLMAENLMLGESREKAYQNMRDSIKSFWVEIDFPVEEQYHFVRLIQEDIRQLSETELKSSGYVIDVLEVAFYYLLSENDYKSSILKAINLGHDTDTAAAITGGLAGLYHGIDNIPLDWRMKLARENDIENLAEKLAKATWS